MEEENDTEVVEHSFHKEPLYDPFDINHIIGLRNYLFIQFNEFSNILKNSLLPPVFKSSKKIQIKIKECDQLPNNYIVDLNSMLSEIKKESKNKDLHGKKNKSNVTLRKGFQIKLIKCYKLAINVTKICSKTLEAGIYNPIQSKMKNLIQIISDLSLTTGKYIYGKLYEKKKRESFDLVKNCNDLFNMLEDCGYKDNDNDNLTNKIENNILNDLFKKSLIKPAKTLSYSANSNRLSMYNQDKPKLGSYYAQGWSKTSFELTRNKVLSEKDNIIKTENNLDNVKTVIEEYPFEESNETNYKLSIKKVPDEKSIDTCEVIKFPTDCNIGLYHMKHNYKNEINNTLTVKEVPDEKSIDICEVIKFPTDCNVSLHHTKHNYRNETNNTLTVKEYLQGGKIFDTDEAIQFPTDCNIGLYHMKHNYMNETNNTLTVKEYLQGGKIFDTDEAIQFPTDCNVDLHHMKHNYKNETHNTLTVKEYLQGGKIFDTDEAIQFPTPSTVLKSDKLKKNSNVGLHHMKHNYWKNLLIKNIRHSQNGNILLNISQKDTEEFHSYRRKFKEYSLRTEHDNNIVSKNTESVIDDLINDVLSKIIDAVIKETIRRELIE